MFKKKVLIIGNWKMHKTAKETAEFFIDFAKLHRQHQKQISPAIKFGFAIPAVNIHIANQHQISSKLIIAGQNAHFEAKGAYTGETSLPMFKALGVKAIIIGHSERRQHFSETNEIINKKVQATLDANLIPIVCVGETLEQRKNREWKSFVSEQIKSLYQNVQPNAYSKIVIAYEPIWAIGTGITASTSEAQEACAFVRSVIVSLNPKIDTSKIIILYGGSVNPKNIASIINQKDINGALVGGASLDQNVFVKILTMNQ